MKKIFVLLILITFSLLSQTEESEKTVTYHSNGNKQLEGEYLGGKAHGKWTEWHENGNKMSIKEYNKGVKKGSWLEWYENGKKKSEKEYKENKKK